MRAPKEDSPISEAGWRAKAAQPAAPWSRNYRSFLRSQIPPFTSRQWRVFAMTYSAELFPTSHRSAASSALVVAGTTGGALGLFLEGALYAFSHSHWTAVRYLTGFWMIGPVIMLLFFPETSGRELELISPA